MKRVLVLVEGQTEETFVKEILRDHLVSKGFSSAEPRIFGNARNRRNRGGIRPWSDCKRDILGHLRRDHNVLVTTMVDYYGLPSVGERAWPGRDIASNVPFSEKAGSVERALFEDIRSEMKGDLSVDRFMPNIVMHEFEALLFSDCDSFAKAIGRSELASQFRSIVDLFSGPEEINDSPDTSPSKRILSLMPRYDKVFFGNLAALDIQLDQIRRRCPHFDSWVSRLENAAMLKE